jgi:hypothetical protein
MGEDSSDKMFFSGLCFFFCLTYPFLILMGLCILVVMGLVFGIQMLFIPEYRFSVLKARDQLREWTKNGQ